MTAEPFRTDGGMEAFRTRSLDSLETLLGGAGAKFVVKVFDDFPGAGDRLKGKALALKALSAEELTECGARALKYLTGPCGWTREDLFSEAGEAMLDFETRVQHLAVALRQPAQPEEPLTDSDHLRQLLETTEVHGLYDRLLTYQEERSPFAHVRSFDDVRETLIAVGKGSASPSVLSRFDNGTLRFMVRVLAADRYGTPTRRPSSATSLPSGSAPTSSGSSG